MFQILTTEDWNVVMYDAMRSTSKWSALYFAALVLIGTYVLINLFVAIMVEGFASDPDAIRQFKETLMRTRAAFQQRPSALPDTSEPQAADAQPEPSALPTLQEAACVASSRLRSSCNQLAIK